MHECEDFFFPEYQRANGVALCVFPDGGWRRAIDRSILLALRRRYQKSRSGLLSSLDMPVCLADSSRLNGCLAGWLEVGFTLGVSNSHGYGFSETLRGDYLPL